MTTSSLLEQELAPLNAQIGQIRGRLEELESELRAAEAELETFSADRLRFDALREACSLLDRLDELQAGHLFWGEAPEFEDPAGHLARVRDRIVRFDDRIGGVLGKQADLKAQANRCVDELDSLYEDVQNAHSRDERREEEFAVVRELSPVPYNPGTLPWSHFDESDERYRRTLRTTMLLSLLLAVIIRLVHVPVPVRPVVAPIPERLAMMVRQEPKKPEPVKKAKEERKETKKEAKAEGKKEEKTQQARAEDKAAPERPKSAPTAQAAAPKRSETAGVLAFKESFRDLMDETAVARLGTEARLSSTAAQANGQAAASRSLVSIAGSGRGGGGNGAISRNAGSGGIGTAALGRSVGGGGGNEARLGRGGAGLAQVKSTIAAAGAKEAKPLSAGGRPARTDEEIQILFDRYKAALYRIYNTELRKDPSLRGKMVLRITIEPGGAVSACAVESTNMNAPGFSDQIVERVKKFNFGPKEGVPKTTILYPIDFLPAR